MPGSLDFVSARPLNRRKQLSMIYRPTKAAFPQRAILPELRFGFESIEVSEKATQGGAIDANKSENRPGSSCYSSFCTQDFSKVDSTVHAVSSSQSQEFSPFAKIRETVFFVTFSSLIVMWKMGFSPLYFCYCYQSVITSIIVIVVITGSCSHRHR